jgi:hypothetical protein
MKRGALCFPAKPWDEKLKGLLEETAQRNHPPNKQLSLINPPI